MEDDHSPNGNEDEDEEDQDSTDSEQEVVVVAIDTPTRPDAHEIDTVPTVAEFGADDTDISMMDSSIELILV